MTVDSKSKQYIIKIDRGLLDKQREHYTNQMLIKGLQQQKVETKAKLKIENDEKYMEREQLEKEMQDYKNLLIMNQIENQARRTKLKEMKKEDLVKNQLFKNAIKQKEISSEVNLARRFEDDLIQDIKSQELTKIEQFRKTSQVVNENRNTAVQRIQQNLFNKKKEDEQDQINFQNDTFHVTYIRKSFMGKPSFNKALNKHKVSTSPNTSRVILNSNIRLNEKEVKISI